jgi:hypothetical protein
MSAELIVYLNKIALTARRGQQECAVEFAATLATGTLQDLKPDDDQLLALPAEVAQSCRRMIVDGAMTALTLGNATAPRLAAVHESTKKTLTVKRSTLLERLRVKKSEDKDHNARALLVFVVRLDSREEWPGRELLGKWLKMNLREGNGGGAA